MPTFITLYKLTEQGVKNIKTAPERITAGIQAFEAMGGKVHGFWATTGEYDYVAIGEAPSEEAGVAYTLAQAAQGNVRTTTMRAYSIAEFAAIVKRIP
jgi:uncharacterized protein with GYD domain